MKRTLIVAGLSGMFIPALASAELNYDAVNVGYSTMRYSNGNQGLTELDVGFSKSYSKDVYLGASYGTASQTTYSGLGNKTVRSISLGAGYHTPLRDNVDLVVAGHIVLGSAKLAGSSTSANGYDIGAGVRTQFAHGLEGSLAAVHANRSNGTYTNTDTFLNAQFGFNFTSKIQMNAGIDLLGHDQTTSLGLRFYY